MTESMRVKLFALATGCVFGIVLAWSQVSDPNVIRSMLLLREAHVFLIMGSAIGVAAVGTRVLRAFKAKSFISHEPIQWTPVPAQMRHVAGSALFGVGWSIAATCPGPAAAMIGQGRLGGLVVAAGILAGVALQPHIIGGRASRADPCEIQGAVGL